MKVVKVFVFVSVLMLAAGTQLLAQHSYSPADIQDGARLYRETCALCHGQNGDAISGAELMQGKFRRAASDEDVIRIIRNGIPGTAMPPNNFTEFQAGTIVAFLRSVAAPSSPSSAADATPSGDPARGKAIFEGKGECLRCHRVNGTGSRFPGPDLSTIGAPRGGRGFGPPTPQPANLIFQQLQNSLLDPKAEVRPENRIMRVVTRDGVTITGKLLNLDTFTIMLLDSNEKLVSFPRANLREFKLVDSPMPSYRDKLSSQEFADLISYLVSLKGQVNP